MRKYTVKTLSTNHMFINLRYEQLSVNMTDHGYSTISVKRSLRDEIREKHKPAGVSWTHYLKTELGIEGSDDR